MGAAHVCPRCGASLTRIRPRRDAHYALPLVICPGCGAAWLRRRDPLQRAWRRGARAAGALLLLGAQAVALVGFAAGSLGWMNELEKMPLTKQAIFSDDVMLLAFGIWGVLCGMWLTAGLSHWRRWLAFASWAALLALLQALVLWLDAPGPPLLSLGGKALLPAAPDPHRLLHRLAIVGGMMLVTTAGIPVGLGVLRLYATNRRERFRRRRQRFRRLWRGA